VSGLGQSGPANAAAGSQSGPAKGTLERVTMHGRSLEGNLEGDSPDRPVVVYLPPSYASDTNRRYPVVRKNLRCAFQAVIVVWAAEA
jgi:hypothetical protein